MKTRKILALLLVLAAVLSFVACGGDSTNATQGGSDAPTSGQSAQSGQNGEVQIPDYLNMDSQMPIVKEGTDITLKVLVVNGPLYQNLESIQEVYFTKAYEERTGVKIEWLEVPSESFGDQLTMMLATNELPDVILKGDISNSNQYKYGAQGYFLDLMENDLLQTYAPNYWALCQKYPEILACSQMPDGQIYSLGMVRNSTGSTVTSKLFFNQTWLDNLELNVPTTQEELYNVLYQFKHGDPNGNGKPDEIGLYLKPEHLEYVTLGMFGIGNRGRNNSFIDYDEETDSVRYFATSDEYRQWIEWVSKLYAEGLLNQEYFDMSESKLGYNISADICGVFAYINLCMIDDVTQKNFTYLNGALTGTNGANDYYGVNSIGSTGSFIITSACQYPEVALRWADYFYSDEGSLFFYFGDEGVTFKGLEDGTYQYTDEVLADYYAGKDSYDGCAIRVSLYGYGNTPTMTKVPYNAADDNKGIALDAANALIEDCAIAWPEFTFTKKEQRVIEDNKADMDKYVRSQRDAWIMGQAKLTDEAWETYLTTIERMGLQDVLEVYEAALQRAYDNGFVEGYHTLDEFK